MVLVKNTTKANNPIYHEMALAFANNSAHSYKTGNECSNHQRESNIQCYVHTLQPHATCSDIICAPLQTLCKSHCTSRVWENYIKLQKLMRDPANAEIWQTMFGKDFGCMAQGDNKMGQKGTNAMFVMTLSGKQNHLDQPSG
jgi:hypothetical protein